MTPAEKDLWVLRRDLLRSLDLDAICTEANKRRLAEMVTEAACPSAETKKKWTRFLADYESGRPVRLPSDECAGPVRMLRLLLQLHRMIAAGQGIRISIPDLVRVTGESPQTLRRAVRDCRRAGLIDEGDRPVNPRHQTGTGANYYELPWLVIEQLSRDPGVQLSLAGCDEVPGVNEDDRSGRPSGRNDGWCPPPTVGGGLPTVGGPPSHSGDPPLPLWEAPPPIFVDSNARRGARARTRPLPLFSKRNTNPPPSSFVEGSGEEEENVFGLPEWKQVERRLKQYPVGLTRRAMYGALKNGWRADQVQKLLDQCEPVICDGERAWGGGAIITHVETCDPGLPMRTKKRPEYLAALARHQERERQSHELITLRAEGSTRQQTASRNAKLEARYGRRLDAMSRNELVALAEESLRPDQFAWFRRHGSSITPLQRPIFLSALERRDLDCRDMEDGDVI